MSDGVEVVESDIPASHEDDSNDRLRRVQLKARALARCRSTAITTSRIDAPTSRDGVLSDVIRAKLTQEPKLLDNRARVADTVAGVRRLVPITPNAVTNEPRRLQPHAPSQLYSGGQSSPRLHYRLPLP